MNAFQRIALMYYQRFGFNVLAVKGKKPSAAWDKWQSEKQSDEDINKLDWGNSTGIGVVMGISDLRLLDLDGVLDFEIMDDIVQDLGLPHDYNWVVQSGSGEGFHISIRCKEPEPSVFEKYGGGKNVF